MLWSDAATEFNALGDHLAAGMSTSLGARGVVPEDHPHYFFLFDMQAAALARNEADVILVVGSRCGSVFLGGMGTCVALALFIAASERCVYL